MASEMCFGRQLLPFRFSASFSASPSTCPWNDSSFHLLFSKHGLSLRMLTELKISARMPALNYSEKWSYQALQ